MMISSAARAIARSRALVATTTTTTIERALITSTPSSPSIRARAACAGCATTAVRTFSSNNNNNDDDDEEAQEELPPLTYDVVPKEDFGQYKEYSVIFTNRSLNLMSDPFQKVMRDLNNLLKRTYNADKVAIIPGSGTYGMESVARQFATDEHVMVIRNGWFSFRWTEIFDAGGENHKMCKSHTVLKAQPVNCTPEHHVQYAPYPIDDVVQKIYEEKPAVLFAPHVETSTGMILPDEYIQKASEAMHDVGGLFVLDCIASGTVWADMKDLGVDVVISAPQKGWTGPACAALVMMSDRAATKMKESENKDTSFSMSLKRWSAIMDAYEKGGFGYHTTMPTDAIRDFHEISVETLKYGLPELKVAQQALGTTARKSLDDRGLVSVAADGYQAPGVLVYYSPKSVENPVMMTRFKSQGLQIAMGVPWRIDEPDGLKTFRIGLFGLDKMSDIAGTVQTLENALDPVLVESGHVNADSTTTATDPNVSTNTPKAA